MNKNMQKNINEDLKKELKDMELNSEISNGKIIDVVYPDKKVNYNETFKIKLIIKLLDDNTDTVSITCPPYETYNNSKLDILQKYAGVKIYDFAKEDIELPVKYENDSLLIDYEEIGFNEKKDTNSYILTETGSDVLVMIIFSFILTIFAHFEASLSSGLILVLFTFVYWINSHSLKSSAKIFESI